MRSVTQEGIELIKHFEGFSESVYICPAGYPTIGFGHVVKSHENFSCGISKTEAEILLREDLQIAERAVKRLITIPLADKQFAALVSFTFNLGSGALQRSTLRHKINSEEHGDIPQEFLRWVWAGGRKLQGLIYRRQAEAVLYASST